MECQEDYNEEELLLTYENFQFKLGTYDVVILVDLPHFSLADPKDCNCEKNCEGIIETGKGEPQEAFRIFKLLFYIRFYANGCAQSEKYYLSSEEVTSECTGYVSTFFETCFLNQGICQGIKNFSLRGTLGIIDVFGNFCYRQTIGASYDVVKEVQKYDCATYEIGLDKFLKRDDILAKSKLFLPNDTLTIRCEITFSVGGVVERFSYWNNKLFEGEELEEQWFLHEEVYDEMSDETVVKHSLILNENNRLGILLKEKSLYFKSLFQTTMKEGLTKLLKIQDDEYEAFYNMVSFVRFETLDHIRNVEECADLYVTADKYDVPSLVESCRKFFKQNMRANTAADLFMFFDLYEDDKMKDFTMQFILVNWYEVKLTDGWKMLEEERRDLIRAMFCLINENTDDVVLNDNECVKAFKTEMECFSIFPNYRKTSFTLSATFDEKLEQNTREYFERVEIGEKWFKHEFIPSDGIFQHGLDLSDPNGLLCTSLRQKSLYFRNLFETGIEEGKSKMLPITESEYSTFYNMLCYARFETLDHIRDIDECSVLFVASDRYEISSLAEDCKDYMRRNLKSDKAAELLMFFDAYKDEKMKEFLIQYILENWPDVKGSDSWKVVEEERQDLINEILLLAVKKDTEMLSGNNENLKAFRKEMKCYEILSKTQIKHDKAIPDIIFFDLLNVPNQEIVIEFILKAGYEGYETANNMGHFEYKDFIYVNQKDLAREIMRFLKKEFLKYFSVKRDALETIKKMAEKSNYDSVLSHKHITMSHQDTKASDVSLEENHELVVRSVLRQWFEEAFCEDWKKMRRENYNVELEDDIPKCSSDTHKSNISLRNSSQNAHLVKDLDFKSISNMDNQIILIEYLLANWNAEVSYQFLNVAMEARFNLYNQSLYVFKEKEKLNFTNDEIAFKFKENDKYNENYYFYQ